MRLEKLSLGRVFKERKKSENFPKIRINSQKFRKFPKNLVHSGLDHVKLLLTAPAKQKNIFEHTRDLVAFGELRAVTIFRWVQTCVIL